MPWNPGLTKLMNLFAELYPTEQPSRQILAQAGLPTGRIQFSSSATSNWHNILTEADLRDRVDALVTVACDDYPNRCDELTRTLRECQRDLTTEAPYTPPPPPDPDAPRLSVEQHVGEARGSEIVGIKIDKLVMPSPEPPPQPEFPIFQVPYHRNPNFTGRDELLQTLRTRFLSDRPGTRVQALTGLGGMGKTQLALEYAYRHQPDYQVLWWLRAEEPTSLAADYAQLARSLHLPEAHLADQPQIIAAVCHWLTHNDGWLLIFDDAAHRDLLQDYLPRTATGHALISSRNPAWRGTARTSRVQPLDLAEATAFLLRRTEQHDQAAAPALAQAVGCLPLALEQAAAFIETTHMPLAEYVTLFSTRRSELWKHEKPAADYPDTVATTWSLSMEKVEEESPDAADLLRLCAFLAPEDIPRDLITAASEGVPEPLASTLQDPLLLSQAVAALRRYSLLETAGDAWALHRLVGDVVRDQLGDDAGSAWAASAAVLIARSFPNDIANDPENWPECDRLLHHALTAAAHSEALRVAPEPTGYLLNQAALYLKVRAFLAQAHRVYERAIGIYEQAFGPQHPLVATAVGNLGTLLQDQGSFAEARAACERALAIDEAAFGPEHPTVAIRLSNLGTVLYDLGELLRARSVHERALAIDEATLGPDHPNVAIRLSNLGTVLHGLRDLEGARAAFERALAIDEAAFGPDHPNVAVRANNLGAVLQDLGDLASARRAYQRVLAIWTEVYGEDHPQVGIAHNNLGRVLQDLGDLTAARAAYERALAIWRSAYGDSHPQVATAHNNLSYLLEELGDLEGAHAAAVRAYTILEASLPNEHPNVQAARRHLEALRQQLHEE